MERGLVLVQMLPAAVVLALAMQLRVLVVFPLLVMLWVLVRAMQLLVVLVVMQLLGYRRQTLRERCPRVCVFWYSFQHSHDFFKQATVLFPRVFGRLTALRPIQSLLDQKNPQSLVFSE
jgi:hypothetical protein